MRKPALIALAALAAFSAHAAEPPAVEEPWARASIAVTADDFRGKWLLVYFGYTHCPDACPTTLDNVAEAMEALPAAEREQIATLFITVDPERETPTVMKWYAGAFPGANVVGLTGTPEQVAAAMRAYRIVARKHETPSERIAEALRKMSP